MSPVDLRVDVVITNHDYGRFVGAAVESALAQTHPGVSVIVVDDGSTDDSRSRLGAFEGEVELLFKPNGGQASAINAAVERCDGDVLIFLDADDTLDPGVAALVAAEFASDKGLSKVQFRMEVVDAEGRPTGMTKPPAHLGAPQGDMRRAELAFPFDLPWLPGGGTAFRADAVRRILPIPEGDFPRHGADWYLIHLTALLGRVGWLDVTGAQYRVHDRNAYEPRDHTLDLDHVRDSIVYAAATADALLRLADQLGLERPEQILSIADIGNRLLSLRLDRDAHSLPGDRVTSLVAAAFNASRRRYEQSWPARGLLLAWVLAVAVAPRPVVPRLGELLLFPERRPPRLNAVLGRLFGRQGSG